MNRDMLGHGDCCGQSVARAGRRALLMLLMGIEPGRRNCLDVTLTHLGH